MSPVTICPLFRSVSGDVVQLQGKFFILYKMSLVSMVKYLTPYCFNAFTAKICSVLLNYVGKFFFTFLLFIILVMFIMSMPLFTKCNLVRFFGLVLVVFDAGGF